MAVWQLLQLAGRPNAVQQQQHMGTGMLMQLLTCSLQLLRYCPHLFDALDQRLKLLAALQRAQACTAQHSRGGQWVQAWKERQLVSVCCRAYSCAPTNTPGPAQRSSHAGQERAPACNLGSPHAALTPHAQARQAHDMTHFVCRFAPGVLGDEMLMTR